MRVEHARIENRKLILTGGGRDFGLPDGTYRNDQGESLTISEQVITDALTQIDTETATKQELTAHIRDLGRQLSTTGDDSQLANIDLQNALQKQQQTLQTMATISKMLHDTTMAIIRKLG